MKKVLITGLGRSGTTLLMAILHKYGYKSDYSDNYVDIVMQKNIGALEAFNDALHVPSPYGFVYKDPDIVKHPLPFEKIGTKVKGRARASKLVPSVFEQVDRFKFKPDFVILCFRDIEQIFKSQRIRRPNKKLPHISTINYNLNLLHSELKDRNLEFERLKFPIYVNDFDYFESKLRFLKLNKEKLHSIYNSLIRKELVHYGD